MKKTLAILIVFFATVPAVAGTLTITYSAAGNAAYTLTATENATVNAYLTQIASQGEPLYPNIGNWMLVVPLTKALAQAKKSVDANNAVNVFDPAKAAIVAPTAQCVAVGLLTGCTTGALRDVICAGLGVSAGCRPQ